MATVNFSVPDDVKTEFDRVFGGQNKSAIIADLMKAIAEATRRKRREDIFRRFTQHRRMRPSLSDAAIRASRDATRR